MGFGPFPGSPQYCILAAASNCSTEGFEPEALSTAVWLRHQTVLLRASSKSPYTEPPVWVNQCVGSFQMDQCAVWKSSVSIAYPNVSIAYPCVSTASFCRLYFARPKPPVLPF